MNLLQLQQGLFYWFRMNNSECKSYASIENVCINICKPYFSKETSPGEIAVFARLNLFFPLFRSGVIEFYGTGKYAVAPSACNCSKAFIAGCNLPNAIKKSFYSDLVYDSLLGIEIYRRSAPLLKAVDAACIAYSEFSFKAIAAKIPSVDTLVNFWEDDVFMDGSGYQMLVPGEGWRHCTEPANNGVFRKSDKVYSQRVAKTGDYRWKLIPSRAINPDAMNIAVTWAETGNITGVVFNTHDLLLCVKNNMFPMLIERILAINSLLHGCQLNDERRYHLPLAEFKILNSILGNKIEVQ